MKPNYWKVLNIGFIATLIAVAGCGQPLVRHESSSGARHEYAKNYQIGTRANAAVGEALLKVKDYYVEQLSALVAAPVANFSVERGVGAPLVFYANQDYKIVGHVNRDGTLFHLVQHTPGWGLVMIDKAGNVDPRVAAITDSGRLYTYDFEWKVMPPSARMLFKDFERVLTAKGFQNFELLYNGISNNSLQFTYREFSPEGIARTAFYQNLSYEANAEYVRFRGFRLKIHKATSEGIEFTVVEDGA